MPFNEYRKTTDTNKKGEPCNDLSILMDLTKSLIGIFRSFFQTFSCAIYFIYLLDMVNYFGIFDKVRSKHFSFFQPFKYKSDIFRESPETLTLAKE